MSIITTGINIVATGVNQAINQVQRFGRELKNTHKQAQSWANGYDQSTKKVEKANGSLRTALNRDWSKEYKKALNGPVKDLEKNLRRVRSSYDRAFRDIGNRYQSMVMGSVALSMSGIGLKNAGMESLGALKASLDVARDFETVMAQVQFYGQKTANEMGQIQKDIFDISYRMPQTASEIGKAFLQAQKTGYDYDSSKVMAEEASKISFMSMGKLDGEESLKYVSQMKKFTNAYATEGERLALVQKGITDSLSVGQLTDRLTMTADVSAASIDSLWKTLQSSRSAYDNMGTDIESMLAISAVMSDRLMPRAAGQALSSFGRGLNMAEKSGREVREGLQSGSRGTSYNELIGAMGGGLESFRGTEGNVDILKYIEGVATTSKEIWGDGVDRTGKLISIFGGSAIDLFHAYDNYAMSGNMNMEQMRDRIREAEGHSSRFMDTIMNTSYGTEMKLKAVAEQFQILFGTSIRPLFNDILDGLTKVIGKVNEFIQQHPKITKALGYGVGLAGILLVASGSIMLVIGGLLALYASIGNVIVQIARNTRVLTMLSGGYATAGAMIKGKLLGPLKLFGAQLLKLSAITFFVWMAWKNDFLRMRTTFTEWKDYISKGLADSQRMFELYGKSSASEWNLALEKATNDGTMDNWVTRNLTKAKILWDGIREMFKKKPRFDAWDTEQNHGWERDGMLDKETKTKLEDMGLLGIVEGLYEAKVAMTDFWNGFQSGVKDGLDLLTTLIHPLLVVWDWLSAKILGLFQHFGYFENVNKGIGSQWEQWGSKLGYIIGSVVAIRVAIWAWMKPLKMMLSPLLKLGDVAEKLKKSFGFLKKISLGNLAKGIGKLALGNPLMSALNAGRFMMAKKFSGNNRPGAQSRLPYARQVIDPTTGKPTGKVTYQKKWWQRNKAGPTVIPSRDGRSSSTIRSRGIGGRMRDTWLGRQYAPDQRVDRRGRTYNQIRTPNGGVMRTTADGRVRGQQVRTGGLKGFLGRYLGNERGAVGRGASGDIGRGASGDTATKASKASKLAQAGGKAGKAGKLGKLFNIANLFKGSSKGMGKVAGTLGKGLVKGLGVVLKKGIPLVFKTALSAFSFIGWALLAWEAISLIWSNWDWIKEKAGLAWDWIKEKAGLVWDWAKEKGGLVWEWTKTKASEAWEWAKTTAGGAWDWVSTKASEIWTSITTFASTMWDDMKSFAKKTWDSVTTIASGVVDTITGFVNNIFSGLYDTAVSAWNNVKTFVTDNPITQTIKTVTDKVTSPFRKGARTGEWYVPKDNMPYNLHQGEMVLKRREAQILRSMVGSDSNSIAQHLLDRDDIASGNVQVSTPPKRVIRPRVKVAEQAPQAPQANGDTTIQVSFEQGAIQVANASPSEMKKGAKQMFEEFKRMVELENMRHYKQARPRTR